MWLKFMNSWFLDYFISHQAEASLQYYLTVTLGIITAAMVSKALRSYFVFSSCLSLSRSLALSMLSSLVHASLHLFFDRASLGRVLNRFLTDAENVDQPMASMGDRILFLA